MKNSKALMILTIFIVLFVIIIGVVFFEKKDNGIIEKENSAISFIQEEIDDIKAINMDEVSERSVNFDVNIIIYDFSDGRISFEVNVLNPKVPMNQVIVSAFLKDKVLRYINTPHSLVSNIIAVKKADKSLKENFNLVPNGEITGISASSNMIYFKNATLNDVLEVIPYIVIKVSWLDDNKIPKVEYVKYKSDKYIIKKNNQTAIETPDPEINQTETGFDINTFGQKHIELEKKLLDMLRNESGQSQIFSEETAGMLNGVSVSGEGVAVVDFTDFSNVIPNAATTAGKGQLFRELNKVVFQFNEIHQVYYQFDGSHSDWAKWLEIVEGSVTREQYQQMENR